MLTPAHRTLMWTISGLYALLGVILFIAPAWSSANFAWKIPPFAAMTIGGWCIGNAVIAANAARVWKWSAIYPNLIYIWIFGLVETLVLVAFRDRLITTGPMAWLYFAALAAAVLSSVIGLLELAQKRPKLETDGPFLSTGLRRLVWFGITVVGIIAVFALTTPADGPVTRGQFLPVALSPFTIRAFGAFYLSLVLSGMTLLAAKGLTPVYMFSIGGMALTLPITAAALIYFPVSSYATHPGGLFYILAYFIVIFMGLAVFAQYRASPAGSTNPMALKSNR